MKGNEYATFEVECGNWTRKVRVPSEIYNRNLLDEANEAMTRAIERHYKDSENVSLGQFVTAKDVADDDPYNTVVCLTSNILYNASKQEDAQELKGFFGQEE